MQFLTSEGCFWPLTASMTSEVKKNHAQQDVWFDRESQYQSIRIRSAIRPHHHHIHEISKSNQNYLRLMIMQFTLAFARYHLLLENHLNSKICTYITCKFTSFWSFLSILSGDIFSMIFLVISLSYLPSKQWRCRQMALIWLTLKSTDTGHKKESIFGHNPKNVPNVPNTSAQEPILLCTTQALTLLF